MSQTRDQKKRFTISEVAADWHELMILQCIMRPSIARAREQFDSQSSQQGVRTYAHKTNAHRTNAHNIIDHRTNAHNTI